jgi:hypothetical protein
MLQADNVPDDSPDHAQATTDSTNGVLETPTVQYIDANAGTSVNYNPIADNSFYNDYTVGSELTNFLSRPVLIQTISWPVGSALTAPEINPWFDFFDDVRIKKKLDNYALISCNLKIKIMINASPFYYGLGLISYKPLTSTFSATTGQFNNNSSIVPTTTGALMQRSQLPHIWIYPSANQGGEMCLPFFHYQNWLNVTTASQFTNMGVLSVSSVTNLISANAAVGQDVTIQIYAWAEDVRIAGPTVGLALQAADEYAGNGIISGPASAVAKAAGYLGKVPVIGKYMTATSVVAEGVSKLAAWFGFTNAPVIRDVEPLKNLPFHGFASSEISTPVEKLTLDPKNELSIDPRVVGLGNNDEMSISHFIQRESYLEVYDWNLTDVPDTLIFGSRIVPELIESAIVGVTQVRCATPMAHISQMFSFWRGDIIFRFRFIASRYHRGRARITYDPAGNIIADPVSSTVAFTRIVDISSENDIEIRVPYMQISPWLDCYKTVSTEYFGGSTFAFTHDPKFDNGNITVRVFTQASAPIAVAPVKVVVSVRAADNLEFAAPRDLPKNLSYFPLQSLEETAVDVPVQVSASNNPTPNNDPNRYLINHGECITSLRQLLRRTSLSRVCSIGANFDRILSVNWLHSRWPLHYGFDLNGTDVAIRPIAGGNGAFNYAFQIPFTWLAPCFSSMRGASRWHINIDTQAPISTIKVHRQRATRVAANYYSQTSAASSSNTAQITRFYLNSGYAGSSGQSLINQFTQTGVSIEAPMYSRFRMISTDPSKVVVGASVDGTDEDTIHYNMIFKPTYNQSSVLGVVTQDRVTSLQTADAHMYHSIGTDFSFHFFLFVPTMAVVNLPVAP